MLISDCYAPRMLTATRQAEILRIVRESGEAAVEDLAARFGVSPSTVRRDLNALSAEGLLRRVRGGGSAGPGVPDARAGGRGAHRGARPGTPDGAAPGQDGQERIAARAAGLVADGDVVLLDAGTTTALLARALRGRPVTVCTASLAVVDELRDDDAVELVVLGGAVRRPSASMAGSLTERALASLRAHTAFLTTSGVGRDGTVMDATGTEVPTRTGMIQAAERTVVLAGPSSFPGVGLVTVCRADQVSTLVTVEGVDPGTLQVFRDAGAEVIQA